MEDLDYVDNQCFLTKLENDLALIFELSYISRERKTNLSVKSLLRKSSNTFKGDYFLSLRSIDASLLQSGKEKIIERLNEVPYIQKSNIEGENLYLSLNRSMIYKCVLNHVKRYKENYGMVQLNQQCVAYLIIVHNEDVTSCSTLRVAIIADHLFSFLKLNGARVHINDYYKYSGSSLKKSSSLCDDLCKKNISMLSEMLINQTKKSEWREDVSNKSDCLTVNVKQFLKKYPLPSRYANTVHYIKIFDNESEVIKRGAHTLHFSHFHKVEKSNIFHISLQNQKHKIAESGLLIEICDLINSPQTFFDCQNVVFKSKPAVSVETYLEYQNKEILKAMYHKYNYAALSNKESEICVKTLVETAVKFTFLKTGTNSPLKINYSDEENSQKNDGIFIQYNFARLYNLLQEFELKVQSGIYEALPPLDAIDFGLLRSAEEWNLLHFIMSFPRLVQDIFNALNGQKYTFHSNRICIMLIELCRHFSLFYSRVRILVNPKPQLQKIMHARLWLLKGVLQIMYNSFSLINIQGIKRM